LKVHFIPEPELEFGASGRHIDIRFGLMQYGPLDLTSDVAPRRIRLGIIGTAAGIEGVCGWFDKCRTEVAKKVSRQPTLFPRFPGFAPDRAFYSTLVLAPQSQRSIPGRVFARSDRVGSDEYVRASVEAFVTDLEHLKGGEHVDVAVCVVPPELVELRAARAEQPRRNQAAIDFHDLLKARAMDVGLPVQLILPSTYDATKGRRQKARPERVRQIQDEATRAWNIHTALYYKAGGLPWRLTRDPTQLTTCFVGVSFYGSLDRARLLTSMAQIFDERGDGIIVRGGPVEIDKFDRTPHLKAVQSRELLTDALSRYRTEHRTLPARVVVHKTSRFSAGEVEGFGAAAADAAVDSIDLVSVSNDDPPHLFRHGLYPPLRGTLLEIEDRARVLYTRGSVDFFKTYPGMYIPRPLMFTCAVAEQTPNHLAQEILALTKMNWNHTQFDAGDPITIEAARKVGRVLKYVGEEGRVAPRYSYYM
jgi:hypothetical protein